MTEFNVGDEITSTEQLRELPIGTILKHLDYYYDRPLIWVKTGADEWAYNPKDKAVSNSDLHIRTREDLLMILVLPSPANWKVGDTVTTCEETYALPKGVICCPANNPDGVGLARDAKFGDWYATGNECGISMSEMKSYLPLRILHLPDGGEQ